MGYVVEVVEVVGFAVSCGEVRCAGVSERFGSRAEAERAAAEHRAQHADEWRRNPASGMLTEEPGDEYQRIFGMPPWQLDESQRAFDTEAEQRGER